MTVYADLVKRHLTYLATARAKTELPFRPAVTPQEFMGLSLLPGAKVLDTVTGLEGVVIGGTIKHTIVSAT
jgi:hypothetical protein